jgi:sec-independent protein translocase protein TatA
MSLSLGHLLIVLLLVFVLFGAGKLPRVMGDIGKGIRNLREGMDADASKQEVLPPEDKVKK